MYYVFLELGNQFLLAARKRKMQRTSNYVISLDQTDLERDSSSFVGKVRYLCSFLSLVTKVIRANFVGTDFTVYDNGDNPSKGGNNIRNELASVIYV